MKALIVLFWKSTVDFVNLMVFSERNVDGGSLVCEVSKEVLRVSQRLSRVICVMYWN